MATVIETINKVRLEGRTQRYNKLVQIGAPSIIIQKEKEIVEQLTAGKGKAVNMVSGVARKYKNQVQLEVSKTDSISVMGHYYKDGKQRTNLLLMLTDEGVMIFDSYGMKIVMEQDKDNLELTMEGMLILNDKLKKMRA